VIEELAKERDAAAKKLAETDAEITRVQKLTQLYPDLKRHVGRWNKVVYCSPSVNGIVTDYETRHNCGCCRDSPLELWPYLETPHGRVYSSPTGIFIGEQDPYTYNDISKPGWREDLRKYGLPEKLIERVAMRFKDEYEKAKEELEARYARGVVEDPEPLL
jgi:hypothetical protein